MQRTNPTVISGWPAVLLLPLLLPAVLIARLMVGKERRERGVDRTPEEVAGILDDFVDGTGGEWDWDEFESVPIKNPTLNALRKRAVTLGPPHPDLEGLRSIAAEARALASA